MKKNEIGRSMIEMLGVLAITGVLGVSSLGAYSKAMEKYKINKTVSQVSEIVQNTRNAFSFHNSKGYSALDFIVKSMSDANYTNRKIADKVKLFPGDISSKNYVHEFGGEIQYFADGLIKKDDGKAFILEYYGVPKEACIDLVTKDWNRNLGLVAMKVKSSVEAYSIQSDALLESCETKYKQGVGLFCAKDFPITPEQAVAVCNFERNNNISWKFY